MSEQEYQSQGSAPIDGAQVHGGSKRDSAEGAVGYSDHEPSASERTDFSQSGFSQTATNQSASEQSGFTQPASTNQETSSNSASSNQATSSDPVDRGFSSLGEGLKSLFFAGAGALVYTGEKSKELMDVLVKKGEETVGSRKTLNTELKHTVEKGAQRIKKDFSQFKTDAVYDTIAHMSPAERDALLERLESMRDEAVSVEIEDGSFGSDSFSSQSNENVPVKLDPSHIEVKDGNNGEH